MKTEAGAPWKIRKIALLTDGIQPYVMGGMQKHSFSLAKYFARQGIDVDLYHFNRSKLDLSRLECFTEDERRHIHSIEVPFPELPRFPGHYLRASWKHSAAILEKLKQRPPADFIYVQGLTGLELLKHKKRGVKLPPVGVNFHGLEMFQHNEGLKHKLSAMQLRRLVKFCFSQADFVFSFGGKIREIVSKLDVEDDRIIELPLGIEREWLAEKIRPVESPVQFLFIGRDERRKGVPELNEALLSLPENLNAFFHFAGPLPENLRLKLRQVKYHGSLHDREAVRSLYAQCDVLIVPSLAEGMPNVIVEAFAAGMAVIATDVGAVAGLVDSSRGWLIPPGEPKAIAKAIREACAAARELDGKKRKALAFAGEHLLWENLIVETLKSIEQALTPS